MDERGASSHNMSESNINHAEKEINQNQVQHGGERQNTAVGAHKPGEPQKKKKKRNLTLCFILVLNPNA